MARFVVFAVAVVCIESALAQYGSHGGLSSSPYGGLSSFGSAGLGGLGGLGSGLYDDGLYGSSSSLGGYGLGPLYGSSLPSRGNTFPLSGLGSPYGSSSFGTPYGASSLGGLYGSTYGSPSGLYGGISPYGSLSSPLSASRLSGLSGGSIYDSFPYAARK